MAGFVGSINLFEGRLKAAGPDRAVVDAEGLGPVHLDRSVAGAAGAAVWVALRPEKIALVRRQGAEPPRWEDAAARGNRAQGVVAGATYLGPGTAFEVTLADGRPVKVARLNVARADGADLGPGTPVWLSWRADAPALLWS